jgi:hypothetical protein
MLPTLKRHPGYYKSTLIQSLDWFLELVNVDLNYYFRLMRAVDSKKELAD